MLNSQRAIDSVIMARGVPMETFDSFKYVGSLLSNNDDNWNAVHANL